MDLLECCTSSGSSEVNWRSPIILVSIRLSLDRVSPVYFYCIQRLPTVTRSDLLQIEIIAHYYSRLQKDELIYFDLHFCKTVTLATTRTTANKQRECASKILRPTVYGAFIVGARRS